MSVRVERTHEDRRARVVFDGGNGNILTIRLLEDFTRVLGQLATNRGLKCVTIEGEGANFSYGASIQEHESGFIVKLLAAMRAAVEQLLYCDVPVLAIVRGQCLGGGLELALACSRIVVSRDAHLGAPEIRLGVVAPVGSLLLPFRVGHAAARDLLCSGRVVRAVDAVECGLADTLALDPEAIAAAHISESWLPHSASSLRFAVASARLLERRAFRENIDEIEKLYLTKLMTTRDAREGLRAFLEKRAPDWNDN